MNENEIYMKEEKERIKEVKDRKVKCRRCGKMNYYYIKGEYVCFDCKIKEWKEKIEEIKVFEEEKDKNGIWEKNHNGR